MLRGGGRARGNIEGASMAHLARKRQAAAYRGRRTNSRARARRGAIALFAELRRGEASLYYGMRNRRTVASHMPLDDCRVSDVFAYLLIRPRDDSILRITNNLIVPDAPWRGNNSNSMLTVLQPLGCSMENTGAWERITDSPRRTR